MPTTQRRHPPPLTSVIDRLLDRPDRFSLFQAVRWIEHWMGRQEGLSSAQMLSQRIAFRNTLSLAFLPSEIAGFEVFESARATQQTEPHGIPASANATQRTGPDRRDSRSVERIAITPAFMGLLGVNGALPHFYSELFAQHEWQTKDDAARAFLDIFQHRAMVLFYQAWRKHRLPIQFEGDRRNRFLPMSLALCGLGQEPLRDRLHPGKGGVADDAVAYFTGAFQQRTASSVTIRQVLAGYFNLPVKLEPFIGRWFALPTENRTRLGLSNAHLGAGAAMGERIWQRDLRMRLTLGPMTREQLSRFLPGGPGECALKELLTLLTGVSLEYEVRLSLRAADVRGVVLTPCGGARLGWDSFLVTQRQREDRIDAGYDVHGLH